MSVHARWLTAAVVVVLALGLLLIGALIVRPALSSPASAWMMGRFWPGNQVDGSSDSPRVGWAYAGGSACPYGGGAGLGSSCSGQTNACAGTLTPTGSPLTLDEARLAVERYLAAYGTGNLRVHEVMEFELNFYAIAEEEDTGIGAFEVLVDKWSGIVRPEPGPNMMWNARYGMMGRWGMMGYGMMGLGGRGQGAMAVTPEGALQRAQDWLAGNLPGVEARADDVDAFYGYYTLHVWKDGRIYGMLSVHGESGQVWYHSWHGAFIAMQEAEY